MYCVNDLNHSCPNNYMTIVFTKHQRKKHSGGGQEKGGIGSVLSKLVTTMSATSDNFGRDSQASSSLTFDEQRQVIDMQFGPDVNAAISDFANNYPENLTTDEKITFKEYLIDNPKKCNMIEKFCHEEKVAYIRKTLERRNENDTN